jgi:DNA repair exonuclease SbcCD nuclease subunit
MILTGDWHLRASRPRSRVDDFVSVQQDKVAEILTYSEENEVHLIQQAGDFFNTPNPPYSLLSVYLELLREHRRHGHLVTVLGQHDLYMYSLQSIRRTATRAMEAAGVLDIAHSDPAIYGGVSVYGASFGEEIPKPLENDTNFKVLIAHRMIGDKALWPGQVLEGPESFLRRNEAYNLIVVGDYHYRFACQKDGRTIVNPGCLVRQTTKEQDLEHQPGFYVFDTDTRELELVLLKTARPAAEVFDLRRTKGEREVDESLLEFVDKLKEQTGIGVSFKENLDRVLTERSASDEVREVIADSMEEVGFSA